MLLGTPLDFNFDIDRHRLRRLNDRDTVGGPLPEDWYGYLIIGCYDYAEGGGARPWIAIRESDGHLCGLDIERTGENTFTFNSSLDRFINTFNLLDPYLRAGRDLPLDCASKADALDQSVFASSEWRSLIDHLTTA